MHEWGLRNVIEGDLNYWKIWISPDKATARGVIRDNPGKFQLVRLDEDTLQWETIHDSALSP